MGMAASQARYLGLTARKTNVEYEGQQINQARTALANQSADLWNEMLNMAVPTAPNKYDYTAQQYSYSDGVNDYEIDSLQTTDYTDENGNKYNYLVKFHYNQDNYKALAETNSNPQVHRTTASTVQSAIENNVTGVKDSDNSYTISNKKGEQVQFKQCTQDDLEDLKALAAKGLVNIDNIENVYKTTDSSTGKNIYATKDDLDRVAEGTSNDLQGSMVDTKKGYKLGNSVATQYDSTDEVQKTALQQIMQDFPDDITEEDVLNNNVWVYTKNGKTYYTTTDRLEDCIKSGEANQVTGNYQIAATTDYQKSLQQYYAANIPEKVTDTKYALLDDASGSGRYQSIRFEGMSSALPLKSEETANDEAYENAMQQYSYDILKYEKRLAEINSKTSLIQVEDRTLELRLRQLDTEQKALSTEMESVKSVIQKNIETVFKTFQ